MAEAAPLNEDFPDMLHSLSTDAASAPRAVDRRNAGG
jgi:hypothetical protein